MKRFFFLLGLFILLLGGLILSPGAPVQADDILIKPTPSGDAPIEIIEEGSAVSPEGTPVDFTEPQPVEGVGQIYLIEETFEGAFPGTTWTVFDCDASDGLEYFWNDVPVNPWAGNWAGWVAAGGANGFSPASTATTYPNNTCAWMKAGPFNLAGVNSGTFLFKYWNKSESGWDYLKWFVSINNVDWYGYVHSGDSGGWQTGTIDLTSAPTLGNITGDTSVWFSIIFDADATNVDSGAYIDNIYLEVYKNCYALNLGWYSDGGAGTNPTASPTSSGTCSTGYYYAGEVITLTAHPDASSTVTRWYGTDNNASTSTTNTVTMPASAAYAGAYYGPAEVRVSFFSVAAQDGWILESTETSGKGGSMNSSNTYLFVGDDKYDKQYRSILSFNTSGIPDGATILSADIGIENWGLVGQDPYYKKTHGIFYCDIRKGYFGSSKSLELGDFSAPASLLNAIKLNRGDPDSEPWFGGSFPATALKYINKTGFTQCRLHFAKDDNDDRGADYLKFLSGSPSSAIKPELTVYYLP